MSDYPKACIIGAGSSGIAAAKVLQEQGIPYDCIEKGDTVGGNWVFKNTNGMSSAYRSLHINTSKNKMAYSDFPMPRDYPDYPHHAQIAKYFNDYADHFGLRKNIQFKRTVTQAALGEDRIWRIKLDNGETRAYDALLVANGHHWDARWPDPAIAGRFEGSEMHSHDYIDPSEPFDLRGKRVVIIGFGNSALDIACEIGRKDVCDAVYLSMRRGYWVMPRYYGARTVDFARPHPSKDLPAWRRLVPRALERYLLKKRLEFTVGRPEQHGLPKPDHDLLESHPAISHDLYNRIGSGDVLPRPDVKRFEGKRVVFADDTSVEADVVIYATGYKISFPFFDPSFIQAPANDIALWQRMIDPRHDNLFFIALLQPLCATMPLAEEQAKVIAAYLRGEYLLPGRADMEAERIAMHEGAKAHWVKTARHTIQVDCASYAFDLRAELKKGRARADLLWPAVAGSGARRSADAPGRGGGMTLKERAPRKASPKAGEPKSKREQTKEANRQAILDAAREVFGDLGYGQTTVRDIIRRTGLASGTFYNYFRSKEEVFEALSDTAALQIRPRLHEVRSKAKTLEEFLYETFLAYFEYVARDRGAFTLMRRNAGHIRVRMDTPEIMAGFAELKTDLAQAMAAGVVAHVDLDYLSGVLIGAAFEMAEQMLAREPPDPAEAARFATALIAGGIGALPRISG